MSIIQSNEGEVNFNYATQKVKCNDESEPLLAVVYVRISVFYKIKI